ncbi:MAG TPA: hypothetical protein VFB58_01195 [Chloroflexota bacterium]|nr:hypothetical protein [Chloroflexota bacterium]
MKFSFAVDEGALVNLPDVTSRNIDVDVTSDQLVVHFGPEFNASIDRTRVASAEDMADPRPRVYFPMGISAAVEQLGRDTICVVTSYQGLVRINFDRAVNGTTVAPNYSGKASTEAGVDVQFGTLILSLEKPAEFIRALRGS